MKFKLFRRIIFYGMLTGLYFMGYCKGYDDCKQNKDGLERIYHEEKEVVLDTLDTVTDTAYDALKKLINENRGE